VQPVHSFIFPKEINEEYRFCKLYRDVRCRSIFAGTSEIMKLIISRGLGLSA